MTSTITTPTIPVVDVEGLSTHRLDVVGGEPRQVARSGRRNRWVAAACAGALVVAAAAATGFVLRSGSVPSTSSVSAVPAIGAGDAAAGSDGREWEQRALAPAEAPNRGEMPVASSTVRPGAAAAAITVGTGHGRLLLQP
jgi:hypothetical protein